AVGTNHTLTITVTAGAGGTLGSGTASASIVSGPGTFVVGPTCDYTSAGPNASHLAVIQATTTLTTVVHAAAGVTVSGRTVHEETPGPGSNIQNATAVWVDADLPLPAALATYAVGTNHTLTITVPAGGGGTLGSGTASASIVSGPGTFVVGPT